MSRRKQSNPKPLKWDECVNEAEDGDGRPERKAGTSSGSIDDDDPDSSSNQGGQGGGGGGGGSGKDVGESGSSYPQDEANQMDCNNSGSSSSGRKRRDLIMGQTGGMEYPGLSHTSKSHHHHHQSRQQQQQQEGIMIKKEGGGGWQQKSPNSHRKYQHSASQSQGLILQSHSPDNNDNVSMDNEDHESALHLYHQSMERRMSKSDGRRSETPEMPNDLNGSSSSSAGPFSHQRIIQAGLPYLHLLPPAIRNDAARLFFMPPILPPELAAAAAAAATSGQAQPLTSSNNNNNNNNAKNEKVAAAGGGGTGGENCRSGPVYMCEPCNIKFSSTRTLEAHQTYYCSFRKETGKDGDKNDLDGGDSTKSENQRESKKRERVSSGEDRGGDLSLDDLRQESLMMVDGGGVVVSGGVSNKSVKTGKLYACIYCSYSADKKVSLNRHMRMHSGPPVSSSSMANNNNANNANTTSIGSNSGTLLDDSSMGTTTGNVREEGGKTDGASALERYCSDCDIQFSSIKTFRVHKQYYCSTRHVLKAQQLAAAAAVAATAVGGVATSGGNSQKQSMDLLGGDHHHQQQQHRVMNTTNSPVSPSDASPVPSSGTPSSSQMGGQPYVVLPTNPVIIVPYCFIQGASILPSNILPTQNALVVLPNGSVQCLPATSTCPSPQSMASLVMSLQHSSATNSNNVSASAAAAAAVGGAASLSPVFNDPKDIIRDIRKICGTTGGGTISTSTTPHHHNTVSRNSSDESSNEPHSHSHHHSHSQSSSQGGGGQDINSESVVVMVEPSTASMTSSMRSHHHRDRDHRDRDREQGGGHDSQPAIDLTLRTTSIKRESHGGADDEKENLGVIYTSGLQIHHHHHHHQSDVMMSRELMNNSPSERLSVGSGGSIGSEKRTPRPSSASISSSCSTPPALCEPKLNGILSRVSPGPAAAASGAAVPLGRNHHHPHHGHGSGKKSSSSSSSLLHHHGNKGIDYSVLEMSSLRSGGGSSSTGGGNTQHPGGNGNNGSDNKISPIATQLPGGAILTSASNQSLAELLLSNPPELNESLAKLNPQLLINSRSSPTGPFNPALMGALTPELALRFLDPAYLASLQHSLQQQQQQLQQQQQQQQQQSQSQQQQGTPPTVKRGVSKCIECDIVFYKFENYLVHKEHYCAARLTNPANSGVTPNSLIPNKNSKERESASSTTSNHGGGGGGAKESASSSCSSPKSELDDTVSPPPSILNCSSALGGRKNSTRSSISSNVSLLRRSPDDCAEDSKNSLGGGKVAKSPCSLTVSPIASPSSIKSEKHQQPTKSGSVVEGQSERYPCLKCGIQFSSLDTLQTHQTFYCRKRAGTTELSNSCGGIGGAAVSLEVEQQQQHRVGKGDRGFVKCPKCRLAVPDDQMNLHSQVCSGGRNGSSSGSISTTTNGWKCPCCETYSPTMSAAQKHLETHTGIRAFKCLLCGYRGNTLRGMRTHIRMHFDKKVSDLQEGDYIACITANNEMESQTTSSSSSSSNNSTPLLIHYPHGAASAATNNNGSNNNCVITSPHQTSSTVVETHLLVSKNVSLLPPPQSLSSSPPPPGIVTSSDRDGSGSSSSKTIKTTCPPSSSSSPPSSSSMMESEERDRFDDVKKESSSSSSSSMASKLENNNRLHFCTLCNYSSSYKGNVVRHMKLVHKISEESADEIVSAAAANSGDSHDSFSKDVENVRSLDEEEGEGGGGEEIDQRSPPSKSPECDRSQVKTNSNTTRQPVNGIGGGEGASNSATAGTTEEGDQQQERHRSSSRSSSEEDLTSSNHSKKKKEESCGVQYCKSCNIYFNYPATFMAHKKFYCSSHVPSDTETVERAETPVQ